MGFFDNLSPEQQDAGLRALIGMGASMMANKNQGLAASLGLGINAGLRQFDRGMDLAKEEQRYQARQQALKDEIARRNHLELQRHAQSLEMEAIRQDRLDERADKRADERYRRSQNLTPFQQAQLEATNLQMDESRLALQRRQAELKFMQEQIQEDRNKKAKELADKVREENEPGTLTKLYNFATGGDDSAAPTEGEKSLINTQRNLASTPFSEPTAGRSVGFSGYGGNANEVLTTALRDFLIEKASLTPVPREARPFNFTESGVPDSRLMQFLNSMF